MIILNGQPLQTYHQNHNSKKKQNISRILGAALLLVLTLFFAGTKVYANSIESLEGASIRTVGTQGLRFDAVVIDGTGILEKGFYVLKGSATLADLTAAIPTMTYNGKTIFKVPVVGVSASNEFSIVLTGMPVVGYMDKITVIPYASLNVGVTDYGTPIVRSVGQVAILMDQATQDPLPQGVEDVLTSLQSFVRARYVENNYELNKGMKDELDNYIDIELYTYYPPNMTTIILPTTREGYAFNGWYSDETFNTPITSVLAADIVDTVVCYGNMTINTYTVTFDTVSGTPVPSTQTVEHGSLATMPTAPTKTNHFLRTWLLDGVPYDFLDGGHHNNSDLTLTNISTLVSYADDNPGGKPKATWWVASHADLSLTDGTLPASETVCTPNIRTDFKHYEVVKKVEIMGVSYLGMGTEVGDIYLEISETRSSWTRIQVVPTSSGGTLTFNNLNIPPGSYLKLVVEVFAMGSVAGLKFNKIVVHVSE